MHSRVVDQRSDGVQGRQESPICARLSKGRYKGIYTVCDVIVTLILIFEGVVFCRRFCPAPWQRGVHRRRAEIVVEGQESSGNSGKSNLIINNIIRINNFFEVDWMSG